MALRTICVMACFAAGVGSASRQSKIDLLDRVEPSAGEFWSVEKNGVRSIDVPLHQSQQARRYICMSTRMSFPSRLLSSTGPSKSSFRGCVMASFLGSHICGIFIGIQIGSGSLFNTMAAFAADVGSTARKNKSTTRIASGCPCEFAATPKLETSRRTGTMWLYQRKRTLICPVDKEEKVEP
jgi:hypothetical protein